MLEILKRKISHLKIFYEYGSSLRKRFVRGVFWSIIGAVISRGLNLVSSIAVARMLGTVGFGELGIIQSTVGLFGTFAGLGVGVTLTKYIAEFKEKDPIKTGRIIGLAFKAAFILGGVSCIVLIVLSPWLAEKILSAPYLSGLLRLSVLLLLFGVINGAQTGALSGFEAFRKIAIVNLISGVIALPLMILGVLFFKLEGAIIALTCSVIINYLLCKRVLKKKYAEFNIKPEIQNSAQELPIIWKFSLPAFLSSLMDIPIIWLCNTMLVNQSDGYAEMGLFNAANQWKNCIVFLPGTLWHFGVAVLSNFTGDSKNYSVARDYYLGISLLLSGIPAIFIIFFSRMITSFYGLGFESMNVILIVLVISGFVWSISNCLYAEIGSRDMMWHMFFLRFLWAVEQLVLTFIFIKEGGLGLAKAYLLSYIMDLIQRFAVLKFIAKNKNAL